MSFYYKMYIIILSGGAAAAETHRSTKPIFLLLLFLILIILIHHNATSVESSLGNIYNQVISSSYRPVVAWTVCPTVIHRVMSYVNVQSVFVIPFIKRRERNEKEDKLFEINGRKLCRACCFTGPFYFYRRRRSAGECSKKRQEEKPFDVFRAAARRPPLRCIYIVTSHHTHTQVHHHCFFLLCTFRMMEYMDGVPSYIFRSTMPAS